MGEDRFEVIAAKTGFAGEYLGAGIMLVPSSVIANGVEGGAIASLAAGEPSTGAKTKPLAGEFGLRGLPGVGLEIAGGSVEISVWNGELGPSSQMISPCSSAGMFALLTGGESDRS